MEVIASSPRLPFTFDQPRLGLGDGLALAGPDRVCPPLFILKGVKASSAKGLARHALGGESDKNSCPCRLDNLRRPVIPIPHGRLGNYLDGKTEVVEQRFLDCAFLAVFSVNKCGFAKFLHWEPFQAVAGLAEALIEGTQPVKRTLGVAGDDLDELARCSLGNH